MKKPNIYYQADLIDMGERASYGYRYIFTCIDAFSKQGFAAPLKKKKEISVLKAFKKIYDQVKEKGKSIKILHTDNGAEFTNKEFKEFLRVNKIKHITGIAGRPQSQGIIEKFNGTLKDYIMRDISALEKNEWYLHLGTYIDNYNNTYHSIIKTTPNKAAEEIESVAENIRKYATKHKKILVHNLQKGDKVRIKIFKGKLEKSSTANFSKKIYKIAKVIESSKPFVEAKFRIKDDDGNYLKNYYGQNDLLKVIGIRKSPVKKNSGSKTSKPKVGS